MAGFLKNINSWKQKSEAAKKKIQSSATDYVRKQVIMVLKDAMKFSPQWSGNYAANWQLSFAGAAASKGWDQQWKQDDWRAVRPVRHAEMSESYQQALDFWTEVVNTQLSWNSNVALVNNAPVAQMIENGEVNLRPVNLIPGGQGVVAFLKTKYSYLSK